MPLVDEIRELGERTGLDLDDLHDYYVHTKAAWRVVQLNVEEGRKFTVSNRLTGTSLDESGLLERSEGYITRNLAVSTFKQTLSLFEDYYFGLQKPG